MSLPLGMSHPCLFKGGEMPIGREICDQARGPRLRLNFFFKSHFNLFAAVWGFCREAETEPSPIQLSAALCIQLHSHDDASQLGEKAKSVFCLFTFSQSLPPRQTVDSPHISFSWCCGDFCASAEWAARSPGWWPSGLVVAALWLCHPSVLGSLRATCFMAASASLLAPEGRGGVD